MGLTRPRAYQIFDLDYKQSVRVVTVSNVTLSGGAPSQVDGVSLSLNDRILVTGQNTASQNGLYYVTTVGTGSNGTWARTIDTNQTGEVEAGMIVMVTEGTVYADTQWKLTTNDPIVVGTTALTFVQNYSANSISGGTSNVVVNANANVTISSAGTANVLTVSSTGTVTSGTASVTGNIDAGNLRTTGTVSATGNVNAPGATFTSNVSIGNVFVGTYYWANGSIFSGGGGGGGTPGGSNTFIQFNDNGVFNGTAGLTFNKTTNAVATTGTFSATANITGGNLLTGGLISATSTITGGNLSTAGTISATGNITGGNLSGTNLTGTLLTASQTNVTSVGTLGSLSVTGNIQGGNLRTAGLISATGSITGSSFSGAGTGLTGTASSLTVGTATTAGTVTTAAQPNITSVGTLSSLTVTANVSGGNILTGGLISATGSITGSSFSGAGTGLTGTASSLTVGTATTAGTVTTAAQPNITSVGTLSSLTVTANVSGGNILTGGLISATGSITGSSFSGAGTGLTGTASSLTVGTATTAGTVTTAAQPNITSVGTLSSLTVTANVTGGNLVTAGQVSATGNITGGNLLVTGNIVDTGALTIVTSSNGNITLSPNGTGVTVVTTDIRNGQATGVGNIGASGATFNTIFAKATSAQYADLAEMYVSDADYPPGTVVEFGGQFEITITSKSHSTAVAGIISTNPSYLMNSNQSGEYVLPVALTGRVPCRVQGPVNKGDVLVSGEISGVAQRLGYNWQPGCTVGKAMESILDNSIQTIEVAVGRL